MHALYVYSKMQTAQEISLRAAYIMALFGVVYAKVQYTLPQRST